MYASSVHTSFKNCLMLYTERMGLLDRSFCCSIHSFALSFFYSLFLFFLLSILIRTSEQSILKLTYQEKRNIGTFLLTSYIHPSILFSSLSSHMDSFLHGSHAFTISQRLRLRWWQCITKMNLISESILSVNLGNHVHISIFSSKPGLRIWKMST